MLAAHLDDTSQQRHPFGGVPSQTKVRAVDRGARLEPPAHVLLLLGGPLKDEALWKQDRLLLGLEPRQHLPRHARPRW